MKKQTTSHILMVRPANFGFNEVTASNNAFQVNDTSISVNDIKTIAKTEFDAFVAKLRAHGIQVFVIEEADTPIRTDSVFPNNWVTFHEDGTVMTYPLFAENRRIEREEAYLERIGEVFQINNRLNFEQYENDNLFLEGTGSMIFDRTNGIVYACLSPRTNLSLLKKFGDYVSAEIVHFQARDANGIDIYHTNVMMALGETFVVICLETIKSESDLMAIKAAFAKTNKEIIEISLQQMESFAGNMLQVRNDQEETFLVMSGQAYRSLNSQQIATIEKHTTILYADIPILETYGGGSVRCMMAEIFLPKKN